MANLMIKCIRGYINQQSYIEEVADAANAQLLPKFDYIKKYCFYCIVTGLCCPKKGLWLIEW